MRSHRPHTADQYRHQLQRYPQYHQQRHQEKHRDLRPHQEPLHRGPVRGLPGAARPTRGYHQR